MDATRGRRRDRRGTKGPTDRHDRRMDGSMSPRAELYIKGRAYLDKPYHLKAIGLPNIYLCNGVTIENDPDYGKLITIEDIPGLCSAIGLHIVTKADAMTGLELRFLRKQMKLTQEALADRLR